MNSSKNWSAGHLLSTKLDTIHRSSKCLLSAETRRGVLRPQWVKANYILEIAYNITMDSKADFDWAGLVV